VQFNRSVIRPLQLHWSPVIRIYAATKYM